MKLSERAAVNFAAKLAPWLAPIPSAFFVARSSIVHLALPLWIAAVVAVIVETLGLATINITLRLWEWNQTKRKTDPDAPTWVAIALDAVYLVTTLGLIVALEVWPFLSSYAPAMFPFLAVVGTVNLALIASHDRREAAIIVEKAERKAERQAKHDANETRTGANDANMTHAANKDAFMVAYRANGHESIAALARSMGVNTRTAQKWVAGANDNDATETNGV